MEGEKLIDENEKTRWFDNGMGSHFPEGYKLLIAERKDDGFREYVLFVDKKPVFASQSFEAIAVHIDVLELL